MRIDIETRRCDKSIILETEEGRSFKIAVDEIANNRATYYAERNSDTTYQEEYDFTYDDNSESYDWLMNNMDWYECESLQELPRTESKLSDLEITDHYFKLTIPPSEVK